VSDAWVVNASPVIVLAKADHLHLGTLGVVLRAKKKGIIHSAADALRRLHMAGLYLDDMIVRTALEDVGEQW